MSRSRGKMKSVRARVFMIGLFLVWLMSASAALAQFCEKEKISKKNPRKPYFCKFACLSKTNAWVSKEWESKGQSLSLNFLDMRGCPPRFLFSFYGWDPLKPYCTDVSISLDRNKFWSYSKSNTKPGSTHKFVEKGIRFECRPQNPAALVWSIDEAVPSAPAVSPQKKDTLSRPMR